MSLHDLYLVPRQLLQRENCLQYQYLLHWDGIKEDLNCASVFLVVDSFSLPFVLSKSNLPVILIVYSSIGAPAPN